jgi:hypothetical protein
MPVERRCPRWWSLTAASGLLGFAVAVAGLGLKAQANPAVPEKQDEKKEAPGPEPVKEEPKADKPLQPADFAQELQKLIREVDPATNPAEFQKRVQELQKRLQRGIRTRVQIAVPPAPALPMAPGAGAWGVARVRHTARLGIAGSAPGDVLAEQLDLPAGKGLVIDQVIADSPAAKAGLKPHDILLQLNGKDVPNSTQELAKIVDEIKANTPVDAVVLRKGKKETIKGITLLEAPQPIPAPRFVAPAVPNPPVAPAFPGGIGQPMQPGQIFVGRRGGPVVVAPAEQGVMTSIFRTDNRFTTRHQEGSLIITVTGTVDTGKSKVNEITVQDGGVTSKYESVAKVPEQYRDKVKNLVEMSEKSSIKIEIKAP